jgi:hypothetical protein
MGFDGESEGASIDGEGEKDGGDGVRALIGDDLSGEERPGLFPGTAVGEIGSAEFNAWKKEDLGGDFEGDDKGEEMGERGWIEVAGETPIELAVFRCVASLAFENEECCEEVDDRRCEDDCTGVGEGAFLPVFVGKKNISAAPLKLAWWSLAWKKLSFEAVGWSGLVGNRSLEKLGVLTNLELWTKFSDVPLAFEYDRSRVPMKEDSLVLVFIFAYFDSTKLGPSPLSPNDPASVSSGFIRLRRSEDRLVIVRGTLFKILFFGVSYPHAAFAVVNPLSRIGVIRPVDFVSVFLGLRIDDTVLEALPRFVPVAGSPTMTRLTAITAVVARARLVEGDRRRTLMACVKAYATVIMRWDERVAEQSRRKGVDRIIDSCTHSFEMPTLKPGVERTYCNWVD